MYKVEGTPTKRGESGSTAPNPGETSDAGPGAAQNMDSTRRPMHVLRPILTASVCLVIISVGVAIAWILVATRTEPPKSDLSVLAPLVETVEVAYADVTETYIGYGSCKAIMRAKIAAEVVASVIERPSDVRAGSHVEKGQVLFRLDDRKYRHIREQAEARAAAEAAVLAEIEADAKSLTRLLDTVRREWRVARDERTRVADLYEKNLAAKKELDFANLAGEQARRVLQGYEREVANLAPRRQRAEASQRGFEAEAKLAALDVERCAILSPFAGRLEAVLVDLGDHVSIGTVVAVVTNDSKVEVSIQLPVSNYSRIEVGAVCRLEAESRTGMHWLGKVSRIAPAADVNTRTFPVYVVIDNDQQQQRLVPGMFVRAVVQGPTHPSRMLVPRRALRNGVLFVAVSASDDEWTAHRVLVDVERYIGDRALLRERLVAGGESQIQRVILSHLDKLAEGMPIRISKPAVHSESHLTSQSRSRDTIKENLP